MDSRTLRVIRDIHGAGATRLHQEPRPRSIWLTWLYGLVLTEFLVAPLLTLLQNRYPLDIAGLSMLQWVRGLLLGGLLLCLFHVPVVARGKLRTFAPILALAVYSGALTLVAAAPLANAVGTFRLAYPCLMGVAAYVVISHGLLGEGGLRRVAWYWLLAYFASQVFALLWGETVYESGFAAAGLGGRASAADGLILLVPFFLLSERWTGRDLAGIGIAVLSVSLTMRRTAMLGVVAAVLVAVACRAVKEREGLRARVVAILLPTAVFAGFAYALTATGWGVDFSVRLADMDITRGGMGAGRTWVWTEGIGHIVQRGALPNVIGEGEGAFGMAMANRLGYAVVAHNGWLTVAVGYGLIGALLYLAFIGRLARLTLGTFRAHDSSFEIMGALLVGILVSEGTQGFILSPSAVPAYVMIAMVLARQRRREWP